MKIPYPYLGDNLVKAKSALFPRWYNAETSNNVIQGVGRGNRRVDDWSTTYILDGCFTALFQKTRHQYSDEFKNRIITLTNKP
jgi:Rad3-related DNA helicase